MSFSGMPFAVKPEKMAGQFVRDCPDVARDKASASNSSFETLMVQTPRGETGLKQRGNKPGTTGLLCLMRRIRASESAHGGRHAIDANRLQTKSARRPA